MARVPLAAVLALLALLSAASARADESAMPYAQQALLVCEQADHVAPAQREALLQMGLRFAERAVEIDHNDAHAHFAVFCTLGKLVERQSIGLETMRNVRRLHHEVNQTLELSPDHVPALLGKAQMLVRLPRWLGGDPDEAARCLAHARAVQAAPPVRLARIDTTISESK